MIEDLKKQIEDLEFQVHVLKTENEFMKRNIKRLNVSCDEKKLEKKNLFLKVVRKLKSIR